MRREGVEVAEFCEETKGYDGDIRGIYWTWRKKVKWDEEGGKRKASLELAEARSWSREGSRACIFGREASTVAGAVSVGAGDMDMVVDG